MDIICGFSNRSWSVKYIMVTLPERLLFYYSSPGEQYIIINFKRALKKEKKGCGKCFFGRKVSGKPIFVDQVKPKNFGHYVLTLTLYFVEFNYILN